MVEKEQEAPPVFSLEKALEIVDGERELLAEMIQLFYEFGPQTAARIQAAVAGGNLEEARRQAHSLKGSAANLAGERLTDLAWSLEQAGREGDQGGLELLVRSLDSELAHLLEALRRVAP